MKRRSFLQVTLLLQSLAIIFKNSKSMAAHKPIEKIYYTKKEWQERLSPEKFYILRQAGTEPPHSSPLKGLSQVL